MAVPSVQVGNQEPRLGCGEEVCVMKWGRTFSKRVDRMYNWSKRFAFFPTQLSDGSWLWLCYYDRKHSGKDDYYGTPWQYRSHQSDDEEARATAAAKEDK